MFREKVNYFDIEEFEKAGVTALYTKKTAGNMSYYSNEDSFNEIVDNRDRILKEIGAEGKQLFYAKQTHSSNIYIIDEDSPEAEYEDIDGFVTDRKDVVILTQYADCLPIFYFDKDKKVIGLIHAGWRGTDKGIQIEALKKMQEIYNSKYENIIIGIGIGIKKCCYEVGKEFYGNFHSKYDKEIINKSFEIRNEKYFFDLEEFNYNLFLQEGIKKENIIKSNICNYCSDNFFSYRKEKEKSGRNAAIIFINEED